MNRFWQGKRVFVTGHTGFKGSWLSLVLKQLGAEVYGYSISVPTSPSLFELCRVQDKLKASTFADVRDLKRLESELKKADPHILLHLAAQPLVRLSYDDPLTTLETNIMGTANVLEAARSVENLRSIVVVTSDKCYENKEWEWGYRENDPMGGHDPYSVSKGCAELVTAAYRHSFFSKKRGVASARAGNVIGGGDWSPDRIMTDVLQAALRKKPVLVRNPSARRPWQHVLEPLRGYLTLAERLYEEPEKYSTGWNFGPVVDDNITVRELLDRVNKLWSAVTWEQDSGSHPHEAMLLYLDASKARLGLNWKPLINLETCIEWTVEWMRAYQENTDLEKVTYKQIQSYCEIGAFQ